MRERDHEDTRLRPTHLVGRRQIVEEVAFEIGLYPRVGQTAHRHLTQIGSGEQRAVDVNRVARARDDGGVATIEKNPHQVAEAFLGSDRVGDFGFDIEIDVPLALVEIGDRLAQLGQTS